jgi:hypothetical protein
VGRDGGSRARRLTGATAVKFGPVKGTIKSAASATSIMVEAPPGTDKVEMIVTTPNGTRRKSTKALFTYEKPKK